MSEVRSLVLSRRLLKMTIEEVLVPARVYHAPVHGGVL